MVEDLWTDGLERDGIYGTYGIYGLLGRTEMNGFYELLGMDCLDC